MNLDWLYYCYTTILGKDESEFWEATPAKIIKQLEIHSDILIKSRKAMNNKNNRNEIRSETVRLKVNK